MKKEPIPKEVKYLDNQCFRNNEDFDLITIHKDIVSIGEDCFINCKAKIINETNHKFETKKIPNPNIDSFLFDFYDDLYDDLF